MLSRNSLFSYALPAALVFAGSAFLIQGEKKPAGQDHGKPADKGAAMQMPQMPTAGPEHAKLKKLVGTWDTTVSMTGMGGMESKGVATYSMVGDFWLTEDFKGDIGGAPFQGRGATGYDPDKKKYVGTWFDSMEPSFMHTEGNFDASGKVLTMVGEAKDMAGQRSKTKLVSEMKDDDTVVFKMFQGGPDGGAMEIMSITYKRKK